MQDVDIRDFESIKKVVWVGMADKGWRKATTLAYAMQKEFRRKHAPINQVNALLNPGKPFSLEILWQAAKVLELKELIFSSYYSPQENEMKSEAALKEWILGLEMELLEARSALDNRKFTIAERIIIKKGRQ